VVGTREEVHGCFVSALYLKALRTLSAFLIIERVLPSKKIWQERVCSLVAICGFVWWSRTFVVIFSSLFGFRTGLFEDVVRVNKEEMILVLLSLLKGNRSLGLESALARCVVVARNATRRWGGFVGYTEGQRGQKMEEVTSRCIYFDAIKGIGVQRA
jgi:hypothetical protein